jgi:hypothetical protein
MLITFPPLFLVFKQDQTLLSFAVKFVWTDHVFEVDNCSAFV